MTIRDDSLSSDAVSDRTAKGDLHGSIPPYGPVNMAGLPANLSIVMGKRCGVKHAEVDRAIETASKFFGYFVDKGAIPYGEHEPWPYHENNGKSSLSAVLFSLQPDRTKETQFFAKMATAGHRNRECGHTGQDFSYLWSALGANAGGPAATAAFFKEASKKQRCQEPNSTFVTTGSKSSTANLSDGSQWWKPMVSGTEMGPGADHAGFFLMFRLLWNLPFATGGLHSAGSGSRSRATPARWI